ncbi:OsmC family protein [Pseudomonas sp. C2L12B]|uniref:OsmC family protein n=1 Tax=Pseudomonas typographi TaxID=2715964 RepID=A0ABR7Z487_9PSED|nr:OsmC family protein [Pseudomonas typographi]MBD1588296.1 OsmC family protein [Pseudomonas typographi]MBD1600267.1 OsmC family protein [Pseudomonas typographi]
MKKKASAVWQGGLKDGKGAISVGSGAFRDLPYGFKARFEANEPQHTNPEELIGAAHAGCFSMALSMILGNAGFTATKIETEAEVSLEQQEGGFSITAIALNLKAQVPGATDEQFQKLANDAKVGCPVSKVLKGAAITLHATLEQ